jgi:hypothetical protein
MVEPKILVLDIETRPGIAYFWRPYDENIGYEQIIDAGGMICWAAKFVGDPEISFYSEWTHTRGEMVRAIHSLMEEADAVVTYNGDKFDLPKLQGEFILEGLKPTPPIASIDVVKTVRKFGFVMNRLAFIGPLLRVGEKVKHEGFGLWRSVMDGDAKAQARMQKYNIQDVVLLERLYKKILPFIKNHPRLRGGDACPACTSTKTEKRGFRHTRFFKIQRNQCKGCGHWFETTREKIK